MGSKIFKAFSGYVSQETKIMLLFCCVLFLFIKSVIPKRMCWEQVEPTSRKLRYLSSDMA